MTETMGVHHRSRLFTVRIWAETRENGMERRGRVRDVATGAFRDFRDWSDLVSFFGVRMEEEGLGVETPRPSDEAGA